MLIHSSSMVQVHILLLVVVDIVGVSVVEALGAEELAGMAFL